jgi:transposase
LDTFPIPARSLERYFKVDGRNLERCYKDHLSGFADWDQLEHASDWMLLPENTGDHLSIDESLHCKDLFTFLSDKDGHGRRGTLIAAVRGTKAEDVSEQLRRIPQEKREAVKEVTMDFSDSMQSIVEKCFPNAMIVIDCFHIIKRVCDGMDEMRMRFKRKAASGQKKEEREFNRKKALRKKARAYYRKRHPRKRGEKRGRPRLRANGKYIPKTLSNGDTEVELLTRAKYILPKSGDDWGGNQRERAKMLFGLYPKLREAYSLVCQLRCIFRDRGLTREMAEVRLHKWYKSVSEANIKEIISARDCIKEKEEYVLNFFINRSTNASAESLNSKMKGFRSELRGVRDLPFYLYRCSMIFG